ncbi:hypothetical protein D024_4331 [Vibrio parahaemolyticus 3259]|nr:hypothetical protein D024_4331 [Vibrio parahaemolyticus 3259]ETJ92636.1 hypothetical protein D041_1478 [Vibrio parahaemolyticus EKP-008]
MTSFAAFLFRGCLKIKLILSWYSVVYIEMKVKLVYRDE